MARDCFNMARPLRLIQIGQEFESDFCRTKTTRRQLK